MLDFSLLILLFIV